MQSWTVSNSTSSQSLQWTVHYLYKEPHYGPVYRQYTSDLCVPPHNVWKNITDSSELFWKISDRNALWPRHSSQKNSTKLKTLLSTGIWKIVPIHTLNIYPRPITLSTRLGNYEILLSPGIDFLRSRKCGSRSKQIFTNPIKNSPRPDNWPLDKLDTDKQTSLKAS